MLFIHNFCLIAFISFFQILLRSGKWKRKKSTEKLGNLTKKVQFFVRSRIPKFYPAAPSRPPATQKNHFLDEKLKNQSFSVKNARKMLFLAVSKKLHFLFFWFLATNFFVHRPPLRISQALYAPNFVIMSNFLTHFFANPPPTQFFLSRYPTSFALPPSYAVAGSCWARRRNFWSVCCAPTRSSPAKRTTCPRDSAEAETRKMHFCARNRRNSSAGRI